MKHRFKHFLGLCFLLFLFQYSTVQAELQESRAILDESFEWETPVGAKKTLERIKRAGFNVYMPRVWLGDGAFWPTKLVSSSPKWKYKPSPNYDPLRNLIRLAHDMKIEVHPWFMVMNRWRDFQKEFYDEGTPPHSFDVHVPEFRKFIVSLILDVVRNYEVDGINLDFIRSKGFCLSKFCEDDYRKKFGRDLQKDVMKYNNINHFKVEKTNVWSYLMQWNRDDVSDIVKTVSIKAKAIKPGLIISVDTIVLIEEFRVQGADGLQWKNDGLIDVIYHMDYKKKPRINLIKKAKKKLVDHNGLMLLVGNVDWPYDDTRRGKEAFSRDAQLTADVLNIARSNGKGVAMWTYRFLTDDQIDKIRDGPFREIAKPAWNN